MIEKWLSVVGIGEDGLSGLTPVARALVDGAEVLVGGERHLAMVPEDGRERHAWPSPIRTLIPKIEGMRGRRVCVLATGDPLHFGVGATLLRGIPVEEMTVVPGLSAFTLACARLGWTRHEVDCLTLHGRPLDLLRAYLQPKAKLLVLTDDGAAPASIAELLREAGYGDSRMAALGNMDGPDETRVEGTANDWPAARNAEFNTVAVDCAAGPAAAHLPRAPGLPDAAFLSDGQLTRREVRAVTLAALAPAPGELLWDVGAGCGSVTIEWMRLDPRNRAVAIERDAPRRGYIADNAAALGAPLLDIVAGEAPGALAGLDPPDAVFVGGGLASGGVLSVSWQNLGPGGRLVANAVTVEGERALLDWHAANGGELRRLSVERAEPVGRFTGWKPAMTVTQYTGVKP